jgi:hypothetical protein
MDWACSTNGEEKCIYVIGGKVRRKEDVSGWIILRWILDRHDGLGIGASGGFS